MSHSMSKVKGEIEILKKVQELDRDLYLASERLEEIPEETAALRQKLESEKNRLKDLESALKASQLRQKEKEGELNQKEAQIKKLDGQLAQVKTNKEYSAMQQEISSLKADNSVLEEGILKAMDEAEAANEEVRKEREHLKQREKDYGILEAELNDKEKKLKESVENLRRQRQEIMAQVDPEIRNMYDAVVQKRQGIALAKVVGETCGVCKIKLRAQILNEVMGGASLTACENCLRFLYIEEAVSPS
jgi:uncharacterized protein